MTVWRGLLVSVRDPAEVEAAIDGGAAIIDVKDPARGSLGAATADTIHAVARAVDDRLPWTCAAGELADVPMHDRGSWFTAISGSGLTPAAVKMGLAGMATSNWQDAWQEALAAVPPAIERVAVAYADWQSAAAPDPRDIIMVGTRAGCGVLLVDTADKSAAGLRGACPAHDLRDWIATARAAGMRVALAGKLTLDEIPWIREFNADVVAMRSAVCSNGRNGHVDAALVRRAAELLAASGEHHS